MKDIELILHTINYGTTVGDCYVAVCGLPERNKDHAIIMAKYSRECLDKFSEVVRGLETKLGPDTSELAIR